MPTISALKSFGQYATYFRNFKRVKKLFHPWFREPILSKLLDAAAEHPEELNSTPTPP
jgi:hypothetical protein